MEIVTKRFLLRDFIEGDFPAFAAYHADPRSLEFYGAEEAKPGHARELLDLFETWAGEQPRRNYQLAIIQRNESQLLVGCCGLRSVDPEAGKAELGIELAPQYWGRYRYAIEVMWALVEFGFGSLELKEICGGTVSVNSRIARLASSFGAVAVTRPTPAWMVAKGWSQVEWRVTREQWESGHLTHALRPTVKHFKSPP
ncbi:MAG: GNAT family N-acetyltransferase [Gammaproteobacteria bacterium]